MRGLSAVGGGARLRWRNVARHHDEPAGGLVRWEEGRGCGPSGVVARASAKEVARLCRRNVVSLARACVGHGFPEGERCGLPSVSGCLSVVRVVCAGGMWARRSER